MAEIVGSSLRRLREGFAEHVGTTPTQALRDIRLSRARADLLSRMTPALSPKSLHVGAFQREPVRYHLADEVWDRALGASAPVSCHASR